MKKLLITVCLSGLLSVPSVVLGAEMAGASLYGSFRTGISFGSGDASLSDLNISLGNQRIARSLRRTDGILQI